LAQALGLESLGDFRPRGARKGPALGRPWAPTAQQRPQRMPPTTFDKLIHTLVAEHEREVRILREELSRLHQVCEAASVVVTTCTPTRSPFEEEARLLEGDFARSRQLEAGPAGQHERPRSESPWAYDGPRDLVERLEVLARRTGVEGRPAINKLSKQEKGKNLPNPPLQLQGRKLVDIGDDLDTNLLGDGRPDEDALTAAFAAAMVDEEVLQQAMATQPVAALKQATNGDGGSPLHVIDSSDLDEDTWLSWQSSPQRSLGQAAAHKSEGRVFDSSATSFSAFTALTRWRSLLQWVQEKQFGDSLPKLSPAWTSVEDSLCTISNAPGGGILNIVQLKSVMFKGAAPSHEEDESVALKHGGIHYMLSSENVVPARWAYITQLLRPLMMHPSCRRRVCWDCLGIGLLMHDLIFIPMQVFENNTDGLPTGYHDLLNYLDFIGATFWSTDIMVSFLTGYYSAEGFVELRPHKIARHYLRSWFPLDALIVSVDWSTMWLGMNSSAAYMRLGKTVSRFMRVLRLLRFLKMNSAMKELMERINSEYVLQLMSLLKTLIFIVIVSHYVACIWYGLGSAGLGTHNWPRKWLGNHPESFSYAYSTALHWSLTQFTPASMEVVPQNTLERFFTIMVIILALVAFSSFVSSITAAMTHIRQINAQQMQEQALIRQFFSEHKISHGMASRVWHFFRKSKKTSTKRLNLKDVPMLKALPVRIKEDLRLEIYLPILSTHPFFQRYHQRDSDALRRVCNSAVQEHSMLVGEPWPKDKVERGLQEFEVEDEGFEVKHMCFVAYGQLECSESSNTNRGSASSEQLNTCLVNRGEWVCESCLWADKAYVPSPLVAAEPTEVILLDALEFQKVARIHETSVSFVAKYAEFFMQRFQGVSKASRMNGDEVLFNSYEMIAGLVQRTEEAITSPTRRNNAKDLILGRVSIGGGIGRLVSRKKTSDDLLVPGNLSEKKMSSDAMGSVEL